MIYQGRSYESTRTSYLQELARVLEIVMGTSIIVTEDCKSLIHVHENNMHGVGGHKLRKEKEGAKFNLTWDDMLDELLEFKLANVHTIVPERSGRIGRWVKKQRYQYKKLKNGQQSLMIADRASRLEEIDFCFTVDRPRTWDDCFDKLLEFMAANGHNEREITMRFFCLSCFLLG